MVLEGKQAVTAVNGKRTRKDSRDHFQVLSYAGCKESQKPKIETKGRKVRIE